MACTQQNNRYGSSEEYLEKLKKYAQIEADTSGSAVLVVKKANGVFIYIKELDFKPVAGFEIIVRVSPMREDKPISVLKIPKGKRKIVKKDSISI